MEQKALKNKLGLFGRTLALLMNRSLMYQSNHPFIKQSVGDVLKIATPLLEKISPLVFILNRDRFYIDEEQLDPRLNVARAVALFKSNDIQSISFEIGLRDSELIIFAELFSSLGPTTNAETLKKSLIQKGVFNIRINHVVFKKVTEDDQVVSRDALKEVTPILDDEDGESRKKFMDTLLESILSDEFAQTLNITNLLSNPVAFTQKMIEADLSGSSQLQQGQPPASSTADGEGDLGTGSGEKIGTDTVLDEENLKAQDGTDGRGSALSTFGQPGAAGRGGDGAFAKGPGSGTITGLGEGTGMGTGFGGTGGPGAGGTGLPGGTGGNAAGGIAGAVAGDLSAAEKVDSGPGAGGHGTLLLHQLEVMHQEVEKHLMGEGDVGLPELAQAIFEMKKQLLEGIQAQKALGIAYNNEKAILQSAEALTDQVILELVKDEYQAGKINVQRMAHIIRRLIPEPADLRRLLPQIKIILLSEGMAPSDYLNLIYELRNELQDEELSRMLQESSEAIGIDGDSLIEEVKRNPTQAAELIYLASELRKKGGDESALSDILIDYVERIGEQLAGEEEAKSPEGQDHVKKVMAEVESSVLAKINQLNLDNNMLVQLEERLNQRMESILDKMRVQWLNTKTEQKGKEKFKMLTVLQTLEHNIGDDEEVADILKTIRLKADEGKIEENNFSQIYEEILRIKKSELRDLEDAAMPMGVLTSEDIMFILEKEVAKAKRYGVPFTALAFAFVNAKPQDPAQAKKVTTEAVLEAALEKMADTFREVDFIGQIGKNKMLVILPMASVEDGKKALARVLRALHGDPLEVNEVQVKMRVAGVAAGFDEDQASDAKAFAKQLSGNLSDMVARIKNIQVLF